MTVAGLGLGACQATRPQVTVDQSAAHTLTAKQIDQVKQGVLSTLKDPYSANFGKIQAAKLALSDNNQSKRGYAVCGEVNSKNSYGGYVGMTPFVGGFQEDLKEFKLLALGDQSGMTAEVLTTCRKAGIPL